MKLALPLLVVVAAGGLAWLLWPAAAPTPQPAPTPSPADAALPPPQPGHAAWITALAPTPHGLYSADSGGHIVGWHVASRRAVQRWRAHRMPIVALHATAKGVLSLSNDGSATRWTPAGERLGQVTLPSRYLNDGAPLGDGVFVVADTGVASRVDVWKHTAHTPDALAAAVAPDAAQVASGGHDGRIRISAAADGQLVRSIAAHDGWVTALVWRGDVLYSAGYDGRLRAWNPATGERRLDVAAHSRPILALAATDTHLLTGSDDFTAVVWDAGGKRVYTLEGAELPVEAVALDAKYAYTGSRDHLVRVWRLDHGTPEAILRGATP